ncbi:MAG: hypothetical protein ACXAEU_22890 [Candidatus Hodarchaeales archaeon]|jgi:hypothetical protein
MNKLRFYDGRTHPIDQERLIEFDVKSVSDRYYSSRVIDAAKVIDDMGPFHLDYTNVQFVSSDLPDIDKRSARLFTLWAEDEESKEVVILLRGFYILVPFKFGEEALKEYHHLKDTSCYPMAVISSIRTVFKDLVTLTEVLDRVKEEIVLNWQKTRQQVIDTLDRSELWERYVLSFDEIIYFSFLCPSIDRELIEALKRNDYRTTGIMQILASPTLSYDHLKVKLHLNEAMKMIKEKKTN